MKADSTSNEAQSRTLFNLVSLVCLIGVLARGLAGSILTVMADMPVSSEIADSISGSVKWIVDHGISLRVSLCMVCRTGESIL